MDIDLARLVTLPLIFSATGDGELPFATRFDDRTITIRINDFPAEPLYSVLVDGEAIADLDDWPAPWTKPDPYLGRA